jgi:hypothetical protein
MHGLARLTEGLARLALGLGRIIEGLVRLDRALSPPGLDIEFWKDSPSSSGGVPASPTLPQLPRLSSDCVPSSPHSLYRIHFFLRLKNTLFIRIYKRKRDDNLYETHAYEKHQRKPKCYNRLGV